MPPVTEKSVRPAARVQPSAGRRGKSEPDELISARTVYRLAGGAIILGALVIAVALFASRKATAQVSGRVVHAGRPVIWGSVILQLPDGRTVSGRIETDGTFNVPEVPPGEVKVAVLSPDPLVQHYATQIKTSRERTTVKQWAALPVDRRLWFPLPRRYEDPRSSGLTLTLKSGANQMDVVLP